MVDRQPEDPMESMIIINRPVYSTGKFNEAFPRNIGSSKSYYGKVKKKLACTVNKICLIQCLLNALPFINVIRTYSVRKYLFGDIISGISLGIIHIAQGMGFALLAGLTPVYGLYSSFYQVMLYCIFGTTAYACFGTMALTALLVGNVVNRETEQFLSGIDTTNGANSTISPLEILDYKVNIAMSLTLISGIIQTLLGLLHLGFITVYLSDVFVSAFTTGVSIHIVYSQIKFVIGVNLKPHSGPLVLIYTSIDIVKGIPHTNVATLLIFVVCVIVILLVKECINERFKAKIKVPIPVDVLIIILCTIASHYGQFEEMYKVKIVGPVPKGLPAPKIPSMINFTEYIVDGFLIAIIGFIISTAMLKIFIRKYRLTVDFNRELIAYGLSNGISAFFQCFVGSTAPPRCLLLDSTGGKTPVSTLVSGMVLLCVLLTLSALFRSIPTCVLAAIIIVSLKGLYLQFRDLKTLWRTNKYDFSIWSVTFLSVVITDVSIGLLIGVSYSLLTVIVRTQFTKPAELAPVDATELFVNTDSLQPGISVGNNTIKVIKLPTSVYFGNAEFFKNGILSIATNLTELQSTGLHSISNGGNTKENSTDKNVHVVAFRRTSPPDGQFDTRTASSVDLINQAAESIVHSYDSRDEINKVEKLDSPGQIKGILIIDMSAVSFIDSAGNKMLDMLSNDLEAQGVLVLFAGIRQCVSSSMSVKEDRSYMSLFDAYVYSRSIGIKI